MPDDQLTDAELSEGLAKGKLAKAPVAAKQMFDYEEWFYRHGETALRELAALREQRTAEREKRAALVREWRAIPWIGEYTTGIRDAADQLAALDQEPKPIDDDPETLVRGH